MEPIHQAAYDGDVAAIDRLVAEDGQRLDARNQLDLGIERLDSRDCTPLMVAAYRGQDAVVERLLALGADMGLQSARGSFATHWACCGNQSSSLALLLDADALLTARNSLGLTSLMLAAAATGAIDCVTLLVARFGDDLGEQLGMVDNDGDSAAHLACCFNHPSTLALLLDAGASMTARGNHGRTPLMVAAAQGVADYMMVLVARLGPDLDAKENGDWTALHLATYHGYHPVASLLVHAGADPTISNNAGRTPLETAHALLEAALIEPQRSRALLKVRTLLEAAHATHKARDKEGLLTRAAINRRAAAGAPVYLKQRVAQAQELPRVSIQHDDNDGEEEKLTACLKYALGLEGGGGVLLDWQEEPAVGMLPEVFVELLELLVPKWDPAQKWRPLGMEGGV